MFCQFTGQQKSDSCLDFPTCDGRSLVIMSKTGGLRRNSLENVVHERIHDRHSLGRDTGVRVYLFQNLIDVDGKGFLPALLPFFLVTGSHRFLCFPSLFNSFSGSLGWHDVLFKRSSKQKCGGQLYASPIYTKRGGFDANSSQPIGNQQNDC